VSALAALLVLAGAALLWPLLRARHGAAIAVTTLFALVFGTVAYGLARGPSWDGAAAFAVSAALVRAAWGRPDERPLPIAPRTLWLVAGAATVAVIFARGAGPGDVLDGLFSSWGGLLFWSPVLWLGFLGIPRAGSGPRDALGPILLVTAVLAALTTDAGPYRGARFAPVLPLLALGLARALYALREFARRHPLVPVAMGIAALVAWNFLLMGQYRDGGIPRDDTVAFPRVARNAAATVSSTIGSPPAWPANWIFAARHDVSPARYDLLAGVDLYAAGSSVDLGGVVDIGHLPTDGALLGRGWGVRHPCGAGACREILGAAELLAPIAEPRDVDVRLVASGTGTLTVTVNGVAVLAAPLADGEHFVRLPRARLRRGMNAIVLTVNPGGRALVDRIEFKSSPARADGGLPP
jgi:hypothetical protein